MHVCGDNDILYFFYFYSTAFVFINLFQRPNNTMWSFMVKKIGYLEITINLLQLLAIFKQFFFLFDFLFQMKKKDRYNIFV